MRQPERDVEGGQLVPRELRAFELEPGKREFVVFEFPLPRPEVAFGCEALSAAERQVAALVLDGKSNKEIAKKRRTSVRTVANQISSVFRKLGVASRAELDFYFRVGASGKTGRPSTSR